MATQEYNRQYHKKRIQEPMFRLKAVWRTMLHRCYNKKASMYYTYGERGIKVCKKWHNFDNFQKDMHLTYKKGLTIDRIDNNKGYSPNNCRWATPLEQGQNTSRSRFLKYNGLIKSLSQWARDINIKRSTLSMRYYVYKWSVDKCLTKEVYHRNTL